MIRYHAYAPAPRFEESVAHDGGSERAAATERVVTVMMRSVHLDDEAVVFKDNVRTHATALDRGLQSETTHTEFSKFLGDGVLKIAVGWIFALHADPRAFAIVGDGVGGDGDEGFKR